MIRLWVWSACIVIGYIIPKTSKEGIYKCVNWETSSSSSWFTLGAGPTSARLPSEAPPRLYYTQAVLHPGCITPRLYYTQAVLDPGCTTPRQSHHTPLDLVLSRKPSMSVRTTLLLDFWWLWMVLLTKIEPAAVVFHNKNLGLSMAPPSQERKIIWKDFNFLVKTKNTWLSANWEWRWWWWCFEPCLLMGLSKVQQLHERFCPINFWVIVTFTSSSIIIATSLRSYITH